MFIVAKNIEDLPSCPGVYTFKNKDEFLYIGKAGNIKERVKQHYSAPSFFLKRANSISYEQTSSEIEALIKEAELIKRLKPKYNVVWKDGKNYFYVSIEENKYVVLGHKPSEIGPFVDGKSLKRALQLLRKSFPYYTSKRHPKKPCTYCHLDLCPGPEPDMKLYRRNIKNLVLVLKGRKEKALKDLKKQMQERSKMQDFEAAGRMRDRYFALERVVLNARIFDKEVSDWQKTKKILQKIVRGPVSRIEGYDVSNIQGKQATASMVVFKDGEPDKKSYRKFKISTDTPNDTAMIKEALKRRAKHKEWPKPDLVVIDGGKPQLSAGSSVIKDRPIMAIAKKNNELFFKKRKFLLSLLPREIFNLILRIRDESHRFAIKYHKQLRKKGLLQ
ncbi:GIY-YIG nuclease family protein [Patescibacteria group bacterium]|nr:GIY-YIG nuclease family protein [Patescibacteria group bacterium]